MENKTIQPRLLVKYNNEVKKIMMEKFKYKSIMEVPKITKICLNRGVNGATNDKKLVDVAIDELTQITGQKAIPTLSKKDISNFKLRKGVPIGTKVTLRSYKMYEFLDRLISIALPRVRDFKGLNDKSFDNSGNYTFGITEQIIFPELDVDKITRITGFDITIVTNTQNKNEALELLIAFGMPFKTNKN